MAPASENDPAWTPLEAYALEHNSRPALTEITLGLLHRFNNAATGIGFLAEQGAAAIEEGHPARKDLEQISEVLRKAQRYLDLIAELHLAEAAEPVYFALDGLLERQMEVIRAALAKGTIVEFTCPKEVVVRASEPLFRQALLHLVRNAREAMEGVRGAILRISVTVEGAQAVIRVQDNGSGLDESVFSRIFEPFVTTKNPALHAGVGAYLAHRIATQAGGEIAAQNLAGRGAEVTLRLPVET